MNITVATKKSRNGKKVYHYFEAGKERGQRWSANIWTHFEPSNRLEEKFNSNALIKLERMRMELMLADSAPAPKLKKDFLRFYQSYVLENERPGKRHLPSSFREFKKFCSHKKINPDELTEENCLNFRRHLLDNFNGETPLNYFYCFKQAIKSAHRAGYFKTNLAEDIKGKKNTTIGRDFLTGDEFIQLCKHPCPNPEVQRAAITSLYTGLAWCDVSDLKYEMIRDGVITIQRKKSKVVGRIPIDESLLPILMTGTGPVFNLPTADGANQILKAWAKAAGISKNITWHCLRLSFSVDLLRNGVDSSTVAGLMLHTSTTMVGKIYRRYMDADGKAAVKKLPRL